MSTHITTVEEVVALRTENAKLREQLVKATDALKQIADHPESKKSTRLDESSYGVGWAFWNVQHIAKAALSDERKRQDITVRCEKCNWQGKQSELGGRFTIAGMVYCPDCRANFNPIPVCTQTDDHGATNAEG